MPRGDGTGPFGQGPRTGRGLGRNQGKGFDGGRPGRGPAGYCLCPACGTKVGHPPGTPCTSINCPKCDVMMTRG